MTKIDVEPVLGAKNCSDLKNPEAIKELGSELDGEFQIYASLAQLVAKEQRAKRQAGGYGNVTGRKVTDKMLRQAVRSAAGQ